MTPYEFELAVANAFQDQGFEITHVGKSFDKGVDFIAKNEEQRVAVQVKMYHDRIVRYQEIMYLYAGQKLYDCTRSVLITANKIDRTAKEVAIKLGVDYFENYKADPPKVISTLFEKNVDRNSSFYEAWQRHIKPLKGKILYTAMGRENVVTEVTDDYLYRKSSSGMTSKIEYKIFETIYYRLIELKSITRAEINTAYTKRASSLITVVLCCIPNIKLVHKPKIGLHWAENE